MLKRYFMMIMAVSLLLFAGCQSQPEKETKEFGEDAVTFTDDMGREVTVEHPERVACLIGSFADIWHLAGGTDSIVATADDTWRYFDIPMKDDVVNLGKSKELNLEQLLACEPDFVLASCNTAENVELVQAFDEMGLTVAYFEVTSIEDYLHMLEICTEITGCTENYETNGTAIMEQVNAATEVVDGSRPRVLYVRASGSSCKVKGSEGSVLGEMLATLDCENIADSETSLLENLSLEKIMEEDPEYIFVVMQSADPKEAEAVLEATLLSQPAWNSLTAVKEGRYYVMDQTLYNLKPNAKWGKAYEELAEILYK